MCRTSRLLILLIWAVPLIAQRYGRPYSPLSPAHNMAPPEFVLKLEPAHHNIRISDSDLGQLKRSTFITADPKTRKVTRYDGVPLVNLLSAVPQHSRPRTLEVYYGFFRTRAISTSELDPDSEPLIADMIDGNHIKGGKPFCLIAKDRQGHFLLIREVTAIRFI